LEDKFEIRDSRTASAVVVIHHHHHHPVEVWRNNMGPPSAETGEKLEGGGPIRFVDMIGAAMAAQQQQQQHQKQQQKQQQQKKSITTTTPSSSGRVDRVSKIDLSVKIEEDSVDEEDEEMQEAQEAAVDHPLPPPPPSTTTTTMIKPTSSKVSESDEGVLKVSKHWVSPPMQETKEEQQQQQAVMQNSGSHGGFRSYGDGQGNNTTVFRDIKALSASLAKSNNDNINIVHGKSSTERGSTVEDGSPPTSPPVSLSGSAASQLQAEVIHTFKNLKFITSCEILGRTVDCF